MYESLKSVQDDPVLQLLPECMRKRGLAGSFVSFNNHDDGEYDGVYFIYGLDFDKVEQLANGSINIRNWMEESHKRAGFFSLDAQAVRLTREFTSSMTLYDDIWRPAELMRTIAAIYRENNIPMPNEIDVLNAYYYRTLSEKIHDEHTGMNDKLKYKAALGQYMLVTDKYSNPNNPEYEKNRLIRDGYIEKDNLASKIKLAKKKEINRVPLEQLVTHCTNISRKRLPIKYWNGLKGKLEKHPELLYSIVKETPVVIDAPNGKDKTDLSTIDICFDTTRREEFDSLAMQVVYPQYFKYNEKQILSANPPGTTICRTALPEEDLVAFAACCELNNVKVYLDANNINHGNNPKVFSVCFSRWDQSSVQEVLDDIIRAKETTSLYDTDISLACDNPQINAYRSRIQQEYGNVEMYDNTNYKKLAPVKKPIDRELSRAFGIDDDFKSMSDEEHNLARDRAISENTHVGKYKGNIDEDER